MIHTNEKVAGCAHILAEMALTDEQLSSIYGGSDQTYGYIPDSLTWCKLQKADEPPCPIAIPIPSGWPRRGLYATPKY